jgi:hypothetical protein
MWILEPVPCGGLQTSIFYDINIENIYLYRMRASLYGRSHSPFKGELLQKTVTFPGVVTGDNTVRGG